MTWVPTKMRPAATLLLLCAVEPTHSALPKGMLDYLYTHPWMPAANATDRECSAEWQAAILRGPSPASADPSDKTAGGFPRLTPVKNPALEQVARCVVGLACDMAADRVTSSHCLTPHARYAKQSHVLRRHLDPLMSTLGYGAALTCALYSLRDDGGYKEDSFARVDKEAAAKRAARTHFSMDSVIDEMAAATFNEALCPVYPRNRHRPCSQGDLPVRACRPPSPSPPGLVASAQSDGGAGATKQQCSTRAPLYAGNHSSPRACINMCQVEFASRCRFYRYHQREGAGEGAHEVNAEMPTWCSLHAAPACPPSPAVPNASEGACDESWNISGYAKKHDSNWDAWAQGAHAGDYRWKRLVLGPTRFTEWHAAWGLARSDGGRGRRVRPPWVLNCGDCTWLLLKLGYPPFIVPTAARFGHDRSTDAGNAPRSEWVASVQRTATEVRGRDGLTWKPPSTWTDELTASWDMHPFGVWLASYGRRKGVAPSVLMDAAVEHPLVNPHLSGIVHGFTWAQFEPLLHAHGQMKTLAFDAPEGASITETESEPPPPVHAHEHAGGGVAAGVADGGYTSILHPPSDRAPNAHLEQQAVALAAAHMARVYPHELAQAKWGIHAAHGLGHGFLGLFGQRRSMELCRLGVGQMLEGVGPNLRGGVTISQADFIEQCTAGVLHTALNSLSVDDLAELAGRGLNSTNDAVCAVVYPLPASYAGALVGSECLKGVAGVIENDARLELVRHGGCAQYGRTTGTSS